MYVRERKRRRTGETDKESRETSGRENQSGNANEMKLNNVLNVRVVGAMKLATTFLT